MNALITTLLVLLIVAVYTIVGIVVALWTRRTGLVEYDDFLDPMQGMFWPVFLFFLPVVWLGRKIADLLIKQK